MNDDKFIFPKWLCRLLSYISAFTYGLYCYSSIHGNPIEIHRWVMTGGFGIMFYLASLTPKQTP